MREVIETAIFGQTASAIWSEEERQEFTVWIAHNPTAGAVIPGSGGLRKVRWSRSGMGKRGGTRVIYYNLERDGTIWLLIAYTKARYDNLSQATLAKLKDAIDG